MNISIVIPNYNGAELLKKNLPHVLEILAAFVQQEKNSAEIIIVDDGSVDASKEVLTGMFANHTADIGVRMLFNDKNYGFSTTVNKGVDAAKGEIVILLNTDVVPHKDFLLPLLGHFSDESVFAVGCMDESIEDGKTVLRGRGVGKWKNGLLHHDAGSLDKTNTLWVSGGSGAFRKMMWDRLGGFTELMNPFYWEDVDLGYRAWKVGYTLVFEPKSVVVHAHEEGSIKQTQAEQKIITISYRNQYMFTLLNATDSNIMIDFWKSFPIRLTKSFLLKNKAEYMGMLQLLMHVPQILQIRKRNLHLFKKSDAEVISEFSAEK